MAYFAAQTVSQFLSISSRIGDFIALTKPRLASLVLFSTMAGYYLGLTHAKDSSYFVLTLLGSSLAAGGSMALNQWLERKRDAQMKRTQFRPLPAERILPQHAFFFGVALCFLGVGILFYAVHPLASLISSLTILIYLGFYTPLKPASPISTIVGAVPGALPPMIGWAAARGGLDIQGWPLFGIIFLWQIPHFFAISWLYREDFAAGGFKMLAVVDASGERIKRQIFIFVACLLPVSLLPTFLNVAGWLYFSAALMLGIFFLHAAYLAKKDLNQHARYLFRASLVYLTAILLFMVLDKK